MIGFALGFMMMPATIGLIAAFAFLGIHFDVNKSDVFAGIFTGIGLLLIGLAASVRFMK